MVEAEHQQRLYKELDKAGRDFFSGQLELRKEVIGGLIRESQIALIAGPFGVGKSWLMADLAVHVALGLDWCGRKTKQRPVIIFDFENSSPTYQQSVKNILNRLGAERPRDLLVYLANNGGEESTKALLTLGENWQSLTYLDRVLAQHPDALVIIDPFELFCSFDMLSGSALVKVYRRLRILLGKYPAASVITSFNLRKKDRRVTGADLLKDPADWLENVSGTLNILNRADVRLGIESHEHDSEIRVINGVRRGEDMHPIFVRSVGEPPDGLAGFALVNAGSDGFHEGVNAETGDVLDDAPVRIPVRGGSAQNSAESHVVADSRVGPFSRRPAKERGAVPKSSTAGWN
jgi:hypothetical protein